MVQDETGRRRSLRMSSRPLRNQRMRDFQIELASASEAAEKVEKQIPRRPEGLLVMTKQKACNGAAEAAPLQNIPQSTFSVASEAGSATAENVGLKCLREEPVAAPRLGKSSRGTQDSATLRPGLSYGRAYG